jgi:hypothetical protein
MEHGLKAMLLILFDLVYAVRPQSNEGVDFAPCRLRVKFVADRCEHRHVSPPFPPNKLMRVVGYGSRFWRNKALGALREIVRLNSGGDIAADYPRQRLATSSRTGVSTSGGALRI